MIRRTYTISNIGQLIGQGSADRAGSAQDIRRQALSSHKSFPLQSAQRSTQYARSTSIFSLAGFEIYGCGNQSVVNFTRRFAERVRGDSVEEYAWTAAALHSLAKCTHNPSDWQAYNSTLNSIVPSRRSYIELETNSSASR